MKKIVCSLVLTLLALTTRDAFALNPKLLKKLAGKFDIVLSAYCPVDQAHCLDYEAPTTGGVYDQLLTFSKKGAISGRWLKRDGLADFLNPTETDVYFTGKITKISSKGKKITAKFTAKGSDGSTITGTLVATIHSVVTFYDLKGAFSVAVPGGIYRTSLLGVRQGK
jgi:hypothetical protein